MNNYPFADIFSSDKQTSMDAYPFADIFGDVGSEPYREPSILGEIPRGLKAGVQHIKGMGYGLTALAGEVLGSQGITDFARTGLAEVEAATPPPAVASYADIENVSDAAKYLAYGISSNILNMGLSMGTGGVGGVAAKMLASGAIKKAATTELAEYVTAQALRRGFMTGAATASIGMETGSIAGDQLAETGKVDAVRAIAGGAAAGLLDVIPEWYLAKKLGWLGKGAVGMEGGRALRMLKVGGQQFLMEAPTEAMQSVIERASVPGKSTTNAEAWDEYINSFILGGMTGGVVGGAGGIFTRGKPPAASDQPGAPTIPPGEPPAGPDAAPIDLGTGKLTPEFFRDVQQAILDGHDREGQPFTKDDAREILEDYKSKSGADPISVKYFETMLGPLEAKIPAPAPFEADVPLGVAPVPTPQEVLAGFNTFLEQGPEIADITLQKNDILTSHPDLADDINKAIVEYEASKPLVRTVAPKILNIQPAPMAETGSQGPVETPVAVPETTKKEISLKDGSKAGLVYTKEPPGGFTEADKVPEKYRKPTTAPIGKNSQGEYIFEDTNGIRKVITVEGKIYQEPVAMIPTRGGIVTKPSTPRDERYEVVEVKRPEEEKPIIVDVIESPGVAAERFNPGDKVVDDKGVRGAVSGEQDRRSFLMFTPEGASYQYAVDPRKLTKIEPATPAPFGSANKMFTEDKAAKAREILKKKLGGIHMGVPLDPEVIQAGIDLAGYYIEGGSRSFTAYSKKMISDLGDAIRPYLKSFYMAVRNYPGFDKAGMNSEAELDAVEVGIVTLEDKQALMEMLQKEDKVYYKKAHEAHPAAGYFRERKDGHITVVSGGGLSSYVFPDDIIRAERDGKPLDISKEMTIIESTEGGVENVNAPNQEPARRDVVGGTPRLDVGELSGEGPGNVPGENVEEVPGREGSPSPDEVGGTGTQGDTGRPGLRGSAVEPDLTAGRPGPERQPAEAVAPGAAPQDQAVGGGKVPQRDSGRANHRIAPEDVLFHSGKVSRINSNIRAIQLLKKLEEKDRQATPAEKKILAEFTGWGAVAEDVFKLKFDEYVRDYHGKTRTIRGYYKTEERPYQPSDKFYGDDLAKYEAWREKYGEKLHPGLGGILTEEEWQAAQESALNAHYTDRPVIQAMWDIAERLGFTGGKVLEPGAGVGHFFGLMPESLAAKSKLSGVELDPVTGRILTKLYPEADIQVTGFEAAKRINDNTFDLVISNFPFGNYPVTDKKHPVYSGWSIHNYFFARSLDAVKPGGLVLSITSHYSMDTTKDGKIREYMAGKAGLVGAIRLPGTAFEKNAGTSVTTDILIFRKKTGNEYPSPQNWRLVVPVDAAEGGKVNVNEYFANNPKMVMGKHSSSGSMFAGKKEYTLLPSPDGTLKEQIEKAAQLLPENIVETAASTTETEKDTIAAAKNAKEGTFTIHDGQVHLISNGAVVPVSFAKDPKKMTQALSYVSIRESRKALIDLMQSEDATDADIAAAQRELNKAYDSYVKKYGAFHKRSSATFLEEDDEYPTVLSLETVEKKYVAGVKLPFTTYIKDEIFSKRTIFPFIEPKTAENVEDALRLSVTYRNGVDLDYVGSLLNISPDEAKTKLLDTDIAFENPVTGQVEAKEEYLSGNVREKLKQAEEAGLKKNVEALTSVLPEDKVIDEIHYKLGSEWLPPAMIDAFIRDVMGVEVTTTRSAIELSNDAATGWSIQHSYLDQDSAVYTQWGAEGLSGVDLIEDALNLRRPEVFDYYEDENGNEKRTKNNEKTLVAQQKQKEIMGYWEGDRLIPGAFRDYVMERPEHISTIERLFNEKANNFVVRQYDVPTFKYFPNASHAVTLYPHQKRAVMRGLIDSGVIYAHAVGTGKTYMYSTLAMELKRIKRARKPMIVVQGSTLKQFAAQAHKLYPTAKILALAKEEISGAQKRQAMMAKVANGDWDMVIIAHSTFNRISMDPVREVAFINEQLAEIEAAIRAEGADPDKSKRDDSLTVKELRKLLKRKRERLLKLADRSQDTAVTFEGLGVDALLVDEAHTYKRGDFFTKMGNIKGLDRGAAQKSFDFMMKTRYVQEKTGGKNVYLATGTPVSNTIAEVWTLLRYSRPDLLKEYGVSQFDGFASMFGDTRVTLEPTETGEYKMIERFNKYSNGVQLINMWLSGADVILQEDVPGWADMVPKLKGGEFTKISIPRPASLDAFIEDIRRRKKEWEDLPGKEKVEQRHVPIVLYGEAKKGSIDLRLVHPQNPDDAGSKVNRTVEMAFKKWKETVNEKGTQLIFSDLFQSPDPDAKKLISKDTPSLGKEFSNPELRGIPRFNLFEDIKKKLVAKGIPADEIAIINEAKYSNDTNKAKLFEKVNDGAIRILMGSTEKLGIGVNVQERLAHVIHIDAPPRPMDFEQRNGRILRPGNGFKEVEVTLLAIVNSMDEVTYNRLQKKQKFTNQLLRGNIPGNTFEDPSDEVQHTLEEMIAIASGNPLVQKRYKLESDIRELETLQTGHAKKLGNLRHSKNSVENQIERYDKDLITSERRGTELKEKFKGDRFVVTIEGKTYKGEKEGTEALTEYADKIREEVEKQYAGKLAEVKAEVEKRLKEAKEVKTKKGEKVQVVSFGKIWHILRDIKRTPSLKLNDTTMTLIVQAHPSTNWSDATAWEVFSDPNVVFQYQYGEYADETYHSYRTVKGLLDNLRTKINDLYGWPARYKELIAKEKKNLADIIEELKKPFEHTQRLADLRVEYADVLSKIGVTAGHEAGDVEVTADEAKAIEAEKPSAEELAALRKRGKQTWDEVSDVYSDEIDNNADREKYSIWMAGKSRAIAILAGYGEGDIKTAQGRLEDAKETWDQRDDNAPYPPEFATVQKIINSIKQGRGRLFKGDQYSIAPDQAGVTLSDVQAIFKGQEVVQPGGENSPVYVKTRGGKYLTIETVNEISPDELDFEYSHGTKFDKETMKIAGSYGDGVVRLVRGVAGRWTLAHEVKGHFFIDAGIINSSDEAILRGHIKGLVRDGKRETANKNDIGGSEDIANFLADASTYNNPPRGLVGRVVARVREFLDRLMAAFGKRAAGAVVRDVESGRIFDRDLTEGAETGTRYAVTKKPGTANIPPETTPKAVGGTKIVYDDRIPEGLDGYYNEKTDTIHVSPQLSPEKQFEIIRHETEHRGQTAKGTLPQSLYIDPKESIDGFMKYFTDPSEVSARAVEKGDIVPKIWEEVFRLRALSGGIKDVLLEVEKIIPKTDVRWIPDREILIDGSGKYTDWALRRVTGKLRPSDPKPIKQERKSIRIFLKNNGNGVIAETKLRELGIEAFSNAPFSVDILITPKNKTALQKIGIELKDHLELPNPSSPPEGGGRVHYSVQKILNNKEGYKPAEPSEENPKSPTAVTKAIRNETDLMVQDVVRRFTPDVHKLGGLKKLVTSPEWYDHPVASRIVRLFVRDRHEIRNEIMQNLNNLDNPDITENTLGALQIKLKNKGLNWKQKMTGQVSKEYQDYGKILDEADVDQVEYSEDNLRKQGYSEDTIQLWRFTRDAYDNALDVQIAPLEEWIEQIKEEAAFKGQSPADFSPIYKTLRGALAQMGQLRGTYAPRLREGNWAVLAERPMSEAREGEKEYHREHRNSFKAAERLARKMRAEGWTVREPMEVAKLPETVYQDTKTASVVKLLEAALEKMGQSPQTEKFNEELLRNVADEIKARGGRSSMIGRREGNVVKGYITDPNERTTVYLNRVANTYAKSVVAQKATEELLGTMVKGRRFGGINPKTEPEVYTTMKDYLEEQLRNADAADRTIGFLKSLATMKFLGFNARSALINMSSVVTTSPGAIHQYVGDGKLGLMKIQRYLGVAGKDAALFMAGKFSGKPDDMKFLQEQKKKGWDDPQYTRDMITQMGRLENRTWASTMDAAMFMFGKTESWNRLTTMLASYRLARGMGKSHEDASELAKTASDKSQGIYGRETLPSVAQGRSGLARGAQVAYVYQKFSHNYLQMLHDLGFKKHNYKAFFYTLLAPMVVSGLTAFPLANVTIIPLFGLLLTLAGLKDEDEDTKKWIWDVTREHLGRGAEVAGRYGVMGALGMDISGSLSIGVGIPRDVWEWAGPIGGFAKDFTEAGKQIGKGNYARSLESVMPAGLANVAKAYRESEEGITTRKGFRVWDEAGKPFVPTTAESLMRTAGFRSSRQAAVTEQLHEAKEQATNFTDKRNAIYEKYRAYLTRPLSKRTEEEHKEIRESVRDYNKKRRELNLTKEVPEIVFSEMRSRITKQMRQPNKATRAWLQ